jgi:hypothetical protein
MRPEISGGVKGIEPSFVWCKVVEHCVEWSSTSATLREPLLSKALVYLHVPLFGTDHSQRSSPSLFLPQRTKHKTGNDHHNHHVD